MKVRRIALLSFFLCAAAVEAATLDGVRILPPNPTSLSDVTIVAWGVGNDSTDRPAKPLVEIRGTTITLHFSDDGTCCTSATVVWYERVRLGNLRGGDYELVLKNVRWDTSVSTRFQVRDVSTFSFWPRSIGNDGSAPVLDFDFAVGMKELTVGGRRVDMDSDGIEVDPTLPPGLHDMTVLMRDGSSITARNAVEIQEGQHRPGTMTERVLVPIYLNGRGAAGTGWASTLLQRSDGSYWEWPGPRGRVEGPVEWVRTDRGYKADSASTASQPSGFFLHVDPRTADDVQFKLDIRETTKNAAAATVPVVRERDFLSTFAWFRNVPFSPDHRIHLRLYSIDGAGRFSVSGTAPGFFTDESVQHGPHGPGFVMVDLTRRADPGTRDLTVAPLSPGTSFWAFISVTDNRTNEVTIITPK